MSARAGTAPGRWATQSRTGRFVCCAALAGACAAPSNSHGAAASEPTPPAPAQGAEYSPAAIGNTLESRLPPGGFRDVAWSDPFPGKWKTVDVTLHGVVPGGGDVSDKLKALIEGANEPAILYFPPGVYQFGRFKITKGDLILKGAGADKTVFQPLQDGQVFEWLGQGGHYDYKGMGPEYQARQVGADVKPGSCEVLLSSTKDLQVGDVVLLEENLDQFTYKSAQRGRGGVFLVTVVAADRVTLDLPLAIGLSKVAPDAKNATLSKLKPVRNVGLEGVRIEMPKEKGDQGPLLRFKRVSNAYVRDVETFNPNGHHCEVAYSRQVVVSGCFFDEAKYKGGGDHNGYGVNFRDLTTGCKAENNIFKDLRHTMATEVGANLCVYAYNLNVDRMRDWGHRPDAPASFAQEGWINDDKANGLTNAFVTGEVCAHGNFPHHILFEGNIVYDAGVDHSHKVNGPHFFFRNRALGQPKRYGGWQQGVGIYVEGDNDNQVIVGNHLANDSIVLLQKHTYPRTSENTLIGANIVKGAVDWGVLPPETALPPSLFRKQKPEYWPVDLAWPPFGPGVKDSATNRIPAQLRYEKLLAARAGSKAGGQ